jgi:hypothetical protein
MLSSDGVLALSGMFWVDDALESPIIVLSRELAIFIQDCDAKSVTRW